MSKTPETWTKGRISAMLIGAPVAAQLFCAGLVEVASSDRELAFALGGHLLLPLWFSLLLAFPLMKTTRKAWGSAFAMSALGVAMLAVGRLA